jgi:hypothetical protein
LTPLLRRTVAHHKKIIITLGSPREDFTPIMFDPHSQQRRAMEGIPICSSLVGE